MSGENTSSRSVEIPAKVYADAEEMASLEGVTVEEYIGKALSDQIAWQRYALKRADADAQRFAGVQERLPDGDFET